jgi:protein ATS1
MSQQLYVFGSNGESQLGVPAVDIVDVPTLVESPPPLHPRCSIGGGDNHTLLSTNQGEVYGVGDNRKAQLVSGQHNSRLETFEELRDGVAFTAATCESSAFIVINEIGAQSNIYIQGSGQWGELGCGECSRDTSATENELVSSPIMLPGRVISFAAGVWHYVAVLDDGSVYGWGKARLGQLGRSLSGKVLTPTKIEDIPFKPSKVVCGKDFTYLAGGASTGEHVVLGKDKFSIITNMPHNSKGWKDIGATWHGIFVLFEDGRLVAWGRNTLWQLVPPNLPPIDRIAIGSEHILAVTKEGKLISWGWGKHGNCGDLSKVQGKVTNDMVSGFWNEIDIPGEVELIAAGYCTSFVVTS